MPITLAQAKVGMANKVDQQVIDNFRRSSILLDKLTFDDCVSPGTGGSTLTYGYTRTKTPATATFRNLNSEYSAQEAVREELSVKLKIFGGKFSIDRVIAETSGFVDEVDYQLQEKTIAATSLFNYTVINGSDALNDGFDGLNVALVGSSTEKGTSSYIDLSTAANLDSNYKTFLDSLDDFLSELNGQPSFLMGNNKLITKIKAVARRAGYLTQSEDAFGKKVDSYNGIPLLDLGFYTDINGGVVRERPVVNIETRTVSSSSISGLTDLYAPVLGIQGFHGVSLKGGKIINTYLPDAKGPGAVKDGEVEMVAAVALKATRAAGVLRNIKVQ